MRWRSLRSPRFLRLRPGRRRVVVQAARCRAAIVESRYAGVRKWDTLSHALPDTWTGISINKGHNIASVPLMIAVSAHKVNDSWRNVSRSKHLGKMHRRDCATSSGPSPAEHCEVWNILGTFGSESSAISLSFAAVSDRYESISRRSWATPLST